MRTSGSSWHRPDRGNGHDWLRTYDTAVPATKPFGVQLRPTWFFQLGMHVRFSSAGMDWWSNGHLYSLLPRVQGEVWSANVRFAVIRSRSEIFDMTRTGTDTARFFVTREVVDSGAQLFYGAGIRMGLLGFDLLGLKLQHRQVAKRPGGLSRHHVGTHDWAPDGRQNGHCRRQGRDCEHNTPLPHGCTRHSRAWSLPGDLIYFFN